jgi:predicted house-cleaning noncanonical NTP pyrophosphatase (MazG superfamily)
MKKFKVYNKLVRDRIPVIIKASGSECKHHTATDEELEHSLLDKLREEVEEFIEKPSVEEMADIQEVIWRIQEIFNITEHDVLGAMRRKTKERGAFHKNYILEHVVEDIS